MRYEILVSLKPEVLDTQARAVSKSLSDLGYSNVKSVKISKRFVVELEGNDDPAAMALQIAKTVLANPVSETFEIKPL